MNRAIVVGLALSVFIVAPAAAQQPLEYNVEVRGETVKGSPGDHYLTFSAPIQLPEVSLPAGTYVFTIVAPSVVRVSSADRAHAYATFFTAPVPQDKAGEDYEMIFTRVDDRSPQRIVKWFLPHRSTGLEFLYPKVDVAGER